MSKTPYATEFFKLVVRELKAAVVAVRGSSRKLLLVDLDQTLWGGVVGDVGWQNLRLGGHDPVGEGFVDFQRQLKRLKQRGVLLGIVSKNEEAAALEAIRSHPEMILREHDFVSWRINWRDKAQNIADLVAELNLGLQSVVFIDDNPVERARIQETLPEVLVPEWPQNPLDFKRALSQLRCFDTRLLSAEDHARTELYSTDRKRREARVQIGSTEEWLASLEMRISVDVLTRKDLERVTQLFNKTNQMNLSTRRLSREELWDWSQQSGNTLLVFRVSDKFGDYGLVGLASLDSNRNGGEARVVDFVLSCRVMSRQVEEAMLHVLIEQARAGGAKLLTATYCPTAKNQPCLTWLEQSGMERRNAGTTFAWDTTRQYAKPSAIKLRLAQTKESL